MINGHLPESVIQEYVLNKTGCETDTVQHMETCETCAASAMAYRSVLAELVQLPKPVFDFELSALVLSQLPASKPTFSFQPFWPHFFAVLIFILLGIPIYLFRKYLLNMVNGISSLFIYAILATALIAMLAKGLSLYKKYKLQMNRLNYY